MSVALESAKTYLAHQARALRLKAVLPFEKAPDLSLQDNVKIRKLATHTMTGKVTHLVLKGSAEKPPEWHLTSVLSTAKSIKKPANQTPLNTYAEDYEPAIHAQITFGSKHTETPF